MALQKQGVNITFGQGLDLKTSPDQVAAGKFLVLSNAIFQTGGQLQKRNGFAKITQLPNTDQTTLTSLADNAVATGSNLYTYNSEINQWLNQGLVQPVDISVQPMVRTAKSQSNVDAIVAPSGLTCLVYMDGTLPYYKISDSVTGQQVVAPVALPTTATNARVFLLGRYFIITFMATVVGAPHFRYIAIPLINPASPNAVADISTSVDAITNPYDGCVTNNALYLSYLGNDVSGAIRTTKISSQLVISTPHVEPSTATTGNNQISVTVDSSGTTPVIWTCYFNVNDSEIDAFALDQNLNSVLATVTVTSTGSDVVPEITSLAKNGMLHIYYEYYNSILSATYQSNYIKKTTVSQSGTPGTPSVLLRSVGLASKAFDYNDTIYMLVTFGERQISPATLAPFQPTYFLIDDSGNIIMKLAYSNGVTYLTGILPNVSINDTSIMIPYLVADLLVSVNKSQGAASFAGIFAQTGVNLADISINSSGQHSSEIAGALNLTGGFLWEYDGVKPVELGFHVWPDAMAAAQSNPGGGLSAQQYYYVFTYEWTDAQGNLHRSAPSIPFGVLVTNPATTVTLDVNTLRLTYKTTPNPVRIVGYRWSTAQQNYYQFTSIQNPPINDPSVDSIQIVDDDSDADILGNTLLYTTGGVIENIAPPACTDSALFKSRLFLIDAEDRNTLWYSKQVIQGTPVEMSDLFTIFVAPTTGAQGSTGEMQAISAMDDKLIIFKKDAIYYLTGNGPDNTGANNDFSEPTYITSSVGCSNPDSIVLQPQGLMFQSDKGIWLLGRDLSTNYIGAPVESYNDIRVNSALSIPGTNQVRFTLDNGVILMYDYFYQQWGTFNGVPSISSTLLNGAHTILNEQGLLLQETPGTYLDYSTPVLMNFTTAWLKLTGLQGYQRAYAAYLVGQYLSPHKLQVNITYDYNPGSWQSILIQPTNFTPNYGGDQLYGSSSPFGGPGSLEQWRIFLDKQKCQAVQFSVSEVYDPSLGIAAGAGFTLSGINLLVGAKLTYPKLSAGQSTS